MKRILLIIAAVLMFLAIGGCGNESIEYVRPVHAYYCTQQISYNSANGVFAAEQREFSGYEDRIKDFLNEYLRGPQDTSLRSPFPLGAFIIDYAQQNDTIRLHLNVHFSRLAPNELTVACACLSKTLFELTDAKTVHIQVDGDSQSNSQITMTVDNIFYADDAQAKKTED